MTKLNIVLTVLLFVLALNIDLFRKLYFVVKFDHNSRQSQIAYDYCEKTGNGYIFYIKKKFNLTRLPKIINYGGSTGAPPTAWIFGTNSGEDSNNIIILFNLDKNNQFRFNLNNYNVRDNHKNDCLYLTKK